MSHARERIDAAKARLLLSSPWFATLLLHLRVVETERVPTMGVDGTNLFYNPAFVDGLTGDELRVVLLHETAHCALLHPYRRKWREPLRWNIACDASVNRLLEADGIDVGNTGIPAFPADATAEEIYEIIPVPPQMLQDVYAPGEMRDGDGEPKDGEAQEHRENGAMGEGAWRDVLASAHGLEPAGLKRVLEQVKAPTADWREILAQFVSSSLKASEHTWSRPSRRIPGLPGWKRDPERSIAVCIDTSGSVSERQLAVFTAEMRAILAVAGVKAYLIAADAQIQAVAEPGDPFPASFPGGGGTDFRPALSRSERLRVDAVVYLTDGEGEYPESCEIPVIWALTKHGSTPWGEKIYVEAD